MGFPWYRLFSPELFSEFSEIMFELFTVCSNIWKGVDTLARVLTGNIVATYMRIFAPALLQAEKCFLLDFSLIFYSLVHVLSIATVKKSPTALNEQVQMGRIAKYMHWTKVSDFIDLQDLIMSNDSSLWWFSVYKRALYQWDPGITMILFFYITSATTMVSRAVEESFESPVQTSPYRSAECIFSNIHCYLSDKKREHCYPAKPNVTRSKVVVEVWPFSFSTRPSYLHCCPFPLSCKWVQVQQQFAKQYMNHWIVLWLLTYQPP